MTLKFHTTATAAAATNKHPKTIAIALNAKELHGYRRSDKAHWNIDEACLRAWVENRPCEHQVATGAAT